jgi:hypothetical protein
LVGLKTNQKILEFTQLLERKIKERQQAIIDQNKTNSPSKPNSSNKLLILSLGGVILLTFIGLLVIKIRHRRRKK